MESEQSTGTRRTRPHPRSYRLSDEDVDLVKQIAEQEQLSQAAIVHLAIRDYAKKHLVREKSTG